MKKKLTTVVFDGTREQEEKLASLIAEYKNVEGNLMPVLQGAQDIYGYLPIEVQKKIAEGLGLSLSEVYGAVSFYSQFALNPKGKVAISVCLGTACYVKGSGKLHEKCMEITGIGAGDISPDGRFSYEATRWHRRMRTCSGHDGERRRLRQNHPRRCRRHHRQISLIRSNT